MREAPPWRISGKELAYSAGHMVSIPGLGRRPREGNGNPFQYSYLGKPIDGGAWGVGGEGGGRLQFTGSQELDTS